MPSIRQLSQSIINKIAAGEVIERPSSVVKELVENAVDAGSTRIDVSIEGGGADLIRVADNGCGIVAEELPLAVACHATSKLTSADDLFQVGTLGFRGEALASIAEVSHLVLRSRVPTSDGGAQLEVNGGELSPTTPCGCPVGTSIEVRNLFFNTPVRRKFLRSTQTELGHTSEAFVRIALASPQIHFTLRHNDRTVFELPVQSRLERIGQVLGRELVEQLLWVESSDGPVQLTGYVALPSQSRNNNRMQYVFLNGRSIRDRSLQHALGEAFRGLLTVGRYPIAILWLTMPAELVDVNVHPTKAEVRFLDSSRLYSQLLATLRTRFLSTDLTSRAQMPKESSEPAAAVDQEQTEQLERQLVDWAKGKVNSWQPDASDATPEFPATSGPVTTATSQEKPAGGEAQTFSPSMFLPFPEPPLSAGPLQTRILNRNWAPAGLADDAGPGEVFDGFAPSPAGQQAATDRPLATGCPIKALQIHNRYLVAESDEGMVVIDQHALHERILYERLRHRIESGPIESQTLLVPEPVDLNPAEMALAVEHRELLAQLGLQVDSFGGTTVLVSSYPTMLSAMRPSAVLQSLLGQLGSDGKPPDRRDLVDDLLHTIACKAAIKAGDRLAPEEMESLLAQRHLVADTHHCPHGRPAALVFSREDLDKQFRRT